MKRMARLLLLSHVIRPVAARLLGALVMVCMAVGPCAEAVAAPAKTSKGRKGGSSKTAAKSTAKKSAAKKSSEAKPAAKPQPPTTVTREMLPGMIDGLLASAGKSTKWGVRIAVLETGDVLYERNPNAGFIPASNRKVFTGALALDQLGPDFQYRTYLYRTGAIDAGGTLQGHLVVRPQGDPTFCNLMARSGPPDWIYRDWVEKVKQAGIKTVAGKLVIDCSEWDMGDLTPKGWTINMLQDNYAPQTSPLTINENIMEVKVKPGAEGKPPVVEYFPPADGYPVLNNATTSASGKGGISVRRNPDGRVEVRGTVSPKAGVKSYGIPIDNPTLFAAAVLRSYMNKAGISIRGTVEVIDRKGTVPPPATDNVVAAYISPPMSEILKHMMKSSDNHFAEQVFVSVSAVKTGRGGYSASRRIENDLLKRAGIGPSEVRFEDGCGLSRLNKVSPNHMTLLLNYMMRHPMATPFFESMAIGGKDGTLRGRMQGRLQQRVYAKTGSIDGVIALSGYLVVRQGTTAVFSMLANDVTSPGSIRGLQDQVLDIVSRLEM